MSGQVPGVSSGEDNGGAMVARLGEVWAGEDAARMRELNALIKRGHGRTDPRLIPREELRAVAPRSLAALQAAQEEEMGTCAGGCGRSVELGRRYGNGCTSGRCKGAAQAFEKTWREREEARPATPRRVDEKEEQPPAMVHAEPAPAPVGEPEGGPNPGAPPDVVHQHQEKEPMPRGYPKGEKCKTCGTTGTRHLAGCAESDRPKVRGNGGGKLGRMPVQDLVQLRKDIDAELQARAHRLEEERKQLLEALGS